MGDGATGFIVSICILAVFLPIALILTYRIGLK